MSNLVILVPVCAAFAMIGIGLAGLSTRRYKNELENEGKASSILGGIGVHYLEGHSFWMYFFTVTFPAAFGGVLMGVELNQIVGWQVAVTITPFILALAIVLMLSIVGYSTLTIHGRSRIRATKTLREYWRNPLAKENFQSRLVEMTAGDEVDRGAVQVISRRGCTASLVAREVLDSGHHE